MHAHLSSFLLAAALLIAQPAKHARAAEEAKACAEQFALLDAAKQLQEVKAISASYAQAAVTDAKKSELLKTMGERPLGEYFEGKVGTDTFELDKVRVEVPKLKKDARKKLVDDFHIFGDLLIAQLELQNAHKVLSPEGENYLELLRRWKKDLMGKKKKKAWLDKKLEKRVNMLLREPKGNQSFSELFRDMFDLYLRDQGQLVDDEAAKGLWTKIKESERFSWLKDLTKDRTIKTYMGYVVITPAIGLAVGYWQGCAYFQLDCPFLPEDSQNYGVIRERRDAFHASIDALEEHVKENTRLAHESENVTEAQLIDEHSELMQLSLPMRNMLFELSQSHDQVRENLLNEEEKRNAMFQIAKQKLYLAKRAKNAPLLAAAKEEYAKMLAIMLVAEAFYPTVGTSTPLTGADRNLGEIPSVANFLRLSADHLESTLTSMRQISTKAGIK